VGPASLFLNINMNANHDFQIGHNHVVCQDFALSGIGITGKNAYAIVCDGCSKSPDVDTGARLLALAAREVLFDDIALTYEEFGARVIKDTSAVRTFFPQLHPQALDATLLISWVYDGIIQAFMFGDGLFFHKTKDFTHTIHVSCDESAPDYLSYQLDIPRLESYKSVSKGKRIDACGDIREAAAFSPVVYKAIANPGDIFGVSSDGVNDFRRADSEPISWYEISKEFTGFKGTGGQFVRRRMQAFQRECEKQQITHGDDISVAAISV
jgi:hypothetical protein